MNAHLYGQESIIDLIFLKYMNKKRNMTKSRELRLKLLEKFMSDPSSI